MVEFTKTIKDPLGLHARPVALLYDIIAKHRSDVSVSIGDRHTDGRDVMGLMALYGECGEDIIFRVSGVDEASCVTSIWLLSVLRLSPCACASTARAPAPTALRVAFARGIAPTKRRAPHLRAWTKSPKTWAAESSKAQTSKRLASIRSRGALCI